MKTVYRYFVQPQMDIRTHAIFGYELLMKKLTPEGWRLQESFAAIDLHTVSDLLIKTTKILGTKVEYCSVNVSREQLMDTEMTQALIKSQLQIYPTKLVVELTEEEGPRNYLDITLIPHLRNFMEHGMQISLDDVGTGDNDFNNIRDFLPLASEMKFALQNFRSLKDHHIHEKLLGWQEISQKYGLRLILEGVEDKKDEEMINKLGINLRQGYYYGKPELLKLPGDPSNM